MNKIKIFASAVGAWLLVFCGLVHASSDLNGDGLRDILWRDVVSGQNWYFAMNGTSVSTSESVSAVTDLTWQVAGIDDFNSDSRADILWRNTVSGQVWMYQMDGSSIVANQAVASVSDLSWKIVGTGDLNADGRADIVWRNSITGDLWLYQMDGFSIASSQAITVVSDLTWNVIGVSDFSGDGKDDILWRNSVSGQLWLYTMDGASISASAAVTRISSPDWVAISFEDFDGDDRADILLRNSASGSVWLYEMDGAAIDNSQAVTTISDLNWDIVATGDFGGDGNADVMWRNAVSGQLWLHQMIGSSIDSSAASSLISNLNWQSIDATAPFLVASGLNARPANLSCIAPDQPTGNASVATQDAFPSLPFLDRPVSLLQAPGDSSEWFVVEQDGRVLRFDNTPGVSSVSTFIDIRGPGGPVDVDSSFNESGLLGMAFHPDFATNGEVFLSYTIDGPSGTFPLTSRISRFTSSDGGQTLDASSEEVLIALDQRYDNHNGGHIAFGPDGYLYIGFGDSGSAGDPGDRSQNTTILHGSLLRIDVDSGSPYGIPADNPFVGNALCSDGDGAAACPETYAWGLRNPWRWTFDSGTGDLWLADVGQDRFEEVNVIELGGNYGWRCREASSDFNTSGVCPPGLIDPEIEYPRVEGQSITGGYLYRGTAIPELTGRYVFADFVNGKLFASVDNGNGNLGYEVLTDTSFNIASFAQEANGELLFLNFGGDIRRIVQSGGSSVNTIPDLLSETGCADVATPSEPSSGLIPYSINAPFWSDGAVKSRWYSIPDGSTIDVDESGDWLFPIGTVLRKDFRLGGELFETRLFMRHTNGEWGGYTYEWNESGTDADRVIGGKVTDVNGQTWTYPSESQCMDCHTQTANFSLGLEHSQLNRDQVFPTTGILANQMQTASKLGLLTQRLPNDSELQPRLADLTVTGPQPPIIDNPGDQLDASGALISLQINAFDVNGDSLSFSATGLPNGLSIDQNGQVTGTPDTIGDSQVLVTVDDGVDGSTQAAFLWSIVDSISCDDCIDFSAITTESYSDQDIDGVVTVLNDGAAIRLDENTWRRSIEGFSITADTFLEFDFESTNEGEVHAIGFDEDLVNSGDRFFNIWGSQPEIGIPYSKYSGSGVQTFVVPIGQYFTGADMSILLINDDDVGSGNNSTFSNVRLTTEVDTVAQPNAPRSYLHTNCAGCHRPLGPTPSSMDLRYGTPLNQTNTCDVAPSSGDLGIVNARLIAPGSAAESIIVARAARRDAQGMPPLASHVIDSEGIALLTSWIDGMTTCP